MPLSPDQAFQHVLCLRLKSDGLQAAAVKRSDKSILEFKEFSDQPSNRETLDQLLSDPFFKYDFADVVATTYASRNTLVPTSIFNVSKPAEIFKFNYTDPIENLDYNRLPELDIVNIFELPLWIKTSLVLHFPRVRVMHHTSVLLKGIFDQPAFHPRVHISLDEFSFDMYITQKNKLEFFNRFDYKTLPDIVYHVLFVLNQKNILQEDASVVLYGVSSAWKNLSEFRSFFKSEVKVADEPEKSEHFILTRQVLCV